MSDTPYQHAIRRREELRKELAEIEEFIRLWTKLFGTETEREATVLPPATASQLSQWNTARRQPTKSPTRSRAAEVAREAILAKGAPMTRGELILAFQERGMPIAGKDPSRNMGTIMWRLREKFVNFEGEGYWPRDVAYPPLGFTPGEDRKNPLNPELNV